MIIYSHYFYAYGNTYIYICMCIMEKLKKFVDNTDEWDLYNGFFLNKDIERLRKFLVREHFFRMSLELTGDILEIGVFKGT